MLVNMSLTIALGRGLVLTGAVAAFNEDLAEDTHRDVLRTG